MSFVKKVYFETQPGRNKGSEIFACIHMTTYTKCKVRLNPESFRYHFQICRCVCLKKEFIRTEGSTFWQWIINKRSGKRSGKINTFRYSFKISYGKTRRHFFWFCP